MKKPFEVGERVSGWTVEPHVLGFRKVIGNYCAGDIVKDPTGKFWACAPNSIRRLVKKERRRVWVLVYPDGSLGTYIYETLASAESVLRGSTKAVCIYEFREVKRK